MKKFLLGAALVLIAINANAADLAVKAINNALVPVFGNPCTVPTASTPLSCSGWFVGAGLAGQGSNADIIGSGVNGSVFAGGIEPFVDGGYQYMQGNWIFGADISAGYAIKSTLAINGIGGGMSGARITEFFKVGGNLSGLLGTAAPITVPASLANSVLGLYVGIGASQWQLSGNSWATGATSGAGILFDIGPRWFGDLGYRYTNFNSAKDGTGVTINNDQSVRLSINYKLN